MTKVKVVKATASYSLEQKINQVLSELEGEFVDLKIAGAYDGENESFAAVIIYK
ncbi:sporulation protein Cse60 [Priestia aryabhattai]|uniref:sporulation protein Cse60 n=1 Tax=Priestia aryabhattai TaxID=412384 RepID=UPI00203F3F80|nr:hypothetical protein [Priestia aryabhattai]MCM3252454.1 hypothetical protein [Priestia aryabhattai]